jgi:hypothetical protein
MWHQYMSLVREYLVQVQVGHQDGAGGGWEIGQSLPACISLSRWPRQSASVCEVICQKDLTLQSAVIAGMCNGLCFRADLCAHCCAFSLLGPSCSYDQGLSVMQHSASSWQKTADFKHVSSCSCWVLLDMLLLWCWGVSSSWGVSSRCYTKGGQPESRM